MNPESTNRSSKFKVFVTIAGIVAFFGGMGSATGLLEDKDQAAIKHFTHRIVAFIFSGQSDSQQTSISKPALIAQNSTPNFTGNNSGNNHPDSSNVAIKSNQEQPVRPPLATENRQFPSSVFREVVVVNSPLDNGNANANANANAFAVDPYRNYYGNSFNRDDYYDYADFGDYSTPPTEQESGYGHGMNLDIGPLHLDLGFGSY